MNRLKRYILIIAAGIAIATSLTSCWNKDYYLFTDDEWSEYEMGDDHLLINGELDLDDMDR